MKWQQSRGYRCVGARHAVPLQGVPAQKDHKPILLAIITIVAMLWITACGRQTPQEDPLSAQQTSIAQTVEAERAIAAAVAATLTAEAAVAAVVEPTATVIPPDNTSPDVPTATATPPVVDENTVATATRVDVPTATPTRLIIDESDVDGNDGNDFLRSSSQSNNGRVVLLPNVEPGTSSDPVLFNGHMALRVEVFDARVLPEDGAGIRTVTFSLVEDFTGEIVYANTEEQAPFCLFGGNDPLCTTLVFVENGLRWPSGVPIYNDSYTARIDIVAQNGEETQWRWGFLIDGAAPRPVPGDNGNGEASNIDFSGAWFTNFAEVALQQDGDSVTGSYRRYGKEEAISLTGSVNGRTLDGYFGSNSADQIIFTLSDDGTTFDGSWLYREDGQERHWCGIRVGLGALPDGCGFSGDWLTISDFRPASQPTARLQQIGPNVSGTFFNGSTSGTIIGNLGEAGPIPHHSFGGIYTINGNSNPMRWDLLDFNSAQFTGCWVNQDGPHEWCGWRPGDPQPAQCSLVPECP